MLCSFCQKKAAAVQVNRSFGTSKRKKQALCMLHYYSTGAIRENPECVTVLDPIHVSTQLPRDLFAEAFIELQRELSEEAAKAYDKNSSDPLAIVSDLQHGSRKRRRNNLKAPPKPSSSKRDESSSNNEGGFMRNVPLPERLIRTQRQQKQHERELLLRMERAAAGHSDDNVHLRRKTSRKVIWNEIMQDDKTNANSPKRAPTFQDHNVVDDAVCSSCGAANARLLMSSASRSQDMIKGEVWGSSNTDDAVIRRLECINCGRVWVDES